MGIMISEVILKLFPHLRWEQRTLDNMSSMPTTPLPLLVSWTFLSHILFSVTRACSFCWNRNKMSQQIEMKSESWEVCSFPKGAWEQRYSLIHQSYFALCTNSGSGPVWTLPPSPPTPPLPSQLHLVAVSWAGWWSSRQQRPVFSFSYTRIIHESFPGSDVESYCDWTQSFWITCSSYCLNWLVSWCLYLEMVCVDESKWLNMSYSQAL